MDVKRKFMIVARKSAMWCKSTLESSVKLHYKLEYFPEHFVPSLSDNILNIQLTSVLILLITHSSPCLPRPALKLMFFVRTSSMYRLSGIPSMLTVACCRSSVFEGSVGCGLYWRTSSIERKLPNVTFVVLSVIWRWFGSTTDRSLA